MTRGATPVPPCTATGIDSYSFTQGYGGIQRNTKPTECNAIPPCIMVAVTRLSTTLPHGENTGKDFGVHVLAIGSVTTRDGMDTIEGWAEKANIFGSK